MADKRYQVFVSSTYKDLQEARHQVMQALLELDCIPAGMELFPASNDDQWTLIKKVIDDSDYYLVIIGGRYGSKDAQGVSYTELEYDYAVEVGKPVMAFLHQDVESLKAADVDLDADARENLAAFRSKAEQRMCRYWSSPEELGGIVSRSYVKLIKSHPATGWVRASEALTPEILSELNTLRQRVSELEQELAQSAPKAPESARSLSQRDDKFAVEIAVDRGFSISREKLKVNVTWDELYRAVGPLMLGGECTELQLRQKTASFAHQTASARARDVAETRNPTVLNFELIKIQLVALGLLQRGSQKRTPSDTNTYWKLTPFGEYHLMAISAIRRDLVGDDG